MDYEWKPPYCTSYNKVGHECKKIEEQPKKKKEVKKVWEHKKIPLVTAETTKTEIKDKDAETQAEIEIPWIVVTNRNRGKALKETNLDENNIVRGFIILGTGGSRTVGVIV